MGDLIVTCASVHSRNRKAGYLNGAKVIRMQQAMNEVKMVVEGCLLCESGQESGGKIRCGNADYHGSEQGPF